MFEPYRQEGKDGYDTIEWAARQPWSNGAVGTFGLSYPGAVQWLAAVERPPSLKAMVPAMTFSTPENFWYSGGVWDGSWLDWTWLNIAPDLRRRLGVPGPRTDEEAARSWERDGAAARARTGRCSSCRTSRAWRPGTTSGCAIRPGTPGGASRGSPGRYDQVSAAVLNLSGWFDEMYGPSGAVENFQGAGDALVLGPWTHGVDAVQRSKAGERDFGPAAALDYDGTVLEWMDRHVKGVDSASGRAGGAGVRDGSRTGGASADRWPIPGTRPDTMYLERPAAGGTGRSW